ncbi:MAG: triphosphoribosyl-dephospho-CoA synthase [Leptothrix sp. (in: b-proteobacteria)]
MKPLRCVRLASPAPWSPEAIGRAATLALHDELALAPKPGLVSFVDSGSHHDMNAHTFMRSLLALRSYFVQISALGAAHAPFESLEQCGLAAETRMLSATGGVNTHRGAIFMLGLLCAAAAAAPSNERSLTATTLRESLQRHWGEALRRRSARPPTLPGGLAARRHGLRSASEEAALGLPVLFETAVPAWVDARARGLVGARVHLQVFFATLAVLDDSNLAHRGGLAGLHFAREQARAFLSGGGATRPEATDHAWAIHRAFVARRLSPGGCADTLSAACLLDRLGAIA